MNLTRKIVAICMLLYAVGLSIANAQSVWIAPDKYSSVVEVVYRSDGRFMDSDNKSQLDYLKSIIEKYRDEITSKECRIWVESYSMQDGAGVDQDRKSAHVLSNLLKSYMILNMGVKESDFTTKNYSGTYDKRHGVSVITIGFRYPFEYIQPLQKIDVSGISQGDVMSSPATATDAQWRDKVDMNKIVSPKFSSANALLYGGGEVSASKSASGDVLTKHDPLFKLPSSLSPMSNAPSAAPTQKVEQQQPAIVYGRPPSAPSAPMASFGSLQSAAAATAAAPVSAGGASQSFGPKSFGPAPKPAVAAPDLTAQSGNSKKSKSNKRSKKADSQPQVEIQGNIAEQPAKPQESITYSQPSIPKELQPKTEPTTTAIIVPPSAPSAPAAPMSSFGSSQSSSVAVAPPIGGGASQGFGPKSFGPASKPAVAVADYVEPTSKRGAGGEKPPKAGKLRKNDMPTVAFNSDGSMKIDATGIGAALSAGAIKENVKVERTQLSATKRAQKEIIVQQTLSRQRSVREAKGRFAIAGFGINALTALVAVPSVQLDFYIHNRFSISLEGTYSYWDLLGDNYRNRIIMISPEVRVWVGKPKKFTGFYVGLYASVGQYNFRFNTPNGVQSSFYSAGLSLGYVLPLGAKSNFFVDFGLAGGYVSEQGEDYFSYKGENFIKDSFVRTGFAPTKARITFIYRFFNQTKR